MGSAGLIIAVHFILLGAYAGAGAAAIAGVRGFLSIKHWAKPLAPVFFLVYVPLGFSAETYIDFLPIAAGLMGTYAMFFTSGIKMRVLFLFGTLLWLVHNGLKGSIGGTLLEVFFLAANTLTIYRMNNERKLSRDVQV